MKKIAYFFINGYVLDKKKTRKNDKDILNIEDKYILDVWNYGVSRDYEKAKKYAISDIKTTALGEENILPHSFVAILKIELSDKNYKTIEDDYMLADFDIFEYIERNTNNIIYSGYFTEDLIYTENFIKYKEKNYE